MSLRKSRCGSPQTIHCPLYAGPPASVCIFLAKTTPPLSAFPDLQGSGSPLHWVLRVVLPEPPALPPSQPTGAGGTQAAWVELASFWIGSHPHPPTFFLPGRHLGPSILPVVSGLSLPCVTWPVPQHTAGSHKYLLTRKDSLDFVKSKS